MDRGVGGRLQRNIAAGKSIVGYSNLDCGAGFRFRRFEFLGFEFRFMFRLDSCGKTTSTTLEK